MIVVALLILFGVSVVAMVGGLFAVAAMPRPSTIRAATIGLVSVGVSAVLLLALGTLFNS